MDEEELRERVECADCGEIVDAAGPAFELPEAAWLCFDCATRRGGVWDGERDEWTVTPDLTGLLHFRDERRPSL